MKATLFIAKRYVFSRSKSSAINIITAITAVGITVGAMVMFIILSVFSGLRTYSLQFINGFDPDLKLEVVKGKTLSLTEEQLQQLSQMVDITAFSTYVEERVLLRHDSKEQIAFIKGVDAEFAEVNQVEDYIYVGQWDPQEYQVCVGYLIAQKLSIGIFDYENSIQLLVPKPGKGSLSHDDFVKLTVDPVGVYSYNDENLDAKYVYADINLARALLGYDRNAITGIDFKITPDSEFKLKAALKEIFGDKVQIKTRAELNESLHKMLNTENFVVYLIITLVIIITLFTLVGALIMAILDKRMHLKTLYAMGLKVKDIRNVFLWQGVLLSFFGCIVGLALGIVVVLIQQYFSLWMISASLAYPVEFTLSNVALVFVTIMILSFLASAIAAWRVNRSLL